MRVLLDTHAFLWWVSDDARLTRKARTAIQDADDVYLSIASCWELAIKVRLEKIALPSPVERFIVEHVALNDITLLQVELEHLGRVSRLPFHHRDPFDRVLAAQALVDVLTLVSADAVFRKYGVKRAW